MSATHIFTSAAGAKGKCDVCGKTRNVKAHKAVAATVEEVRAGAGDAKVADAMEQAGIAVAPARETVSTWVGRKLSELAEADEVVGPLFKAAKPNKAGDRTVRVNRAQSDALAALATSLEASGGALSYSARTLRGRLDAAWNA